ncbi:MAG: PocR ligand-binding domain-containing protein [Firmicutes bacterium]|nr:PocR ligand-binding domain-containing protein [Candidatus Fermentithermobacillaceae bacterium]
MLKDKSGFYEELRKTGLQELLEEILSRALGLTVVFAYPDGRPLTEPSNQCPFYAMLEANPQALARCVASRAASAVAAAVAGEQVLHTCHAGLVYQAVPIRVSGETVAVVLGGNVAVRPPGQETVTRLVRETGIDAERILEAAAMVKVWTEERLQAVMAAVAKLTEMVAELLYAKQELGKKVDQFATLFEFSQAVSESLDVVKVARRGLQSVLELTGASNGSVVMLPQALGLSAAEVAAAVESRDEFPAVPPGEVIATVEREAGGAYFDRSSEGGPPAKRRRAVALPLMVRGRVTGMLTLEGRCADAGFAEDEIAFLTEMGTSLGLALENARQYSSLREYYLSVVRALASAIEAKDVYTRGHSLRVARWARACARVLGLGADEQEEVYLAGLLHDLGKVGIRESVLLKPGCLDEQERKEMQGHPVLGARILEPAKFSDAVIEAVRHHHEDYCGGGYPAGLVGEEIPLFARIIRVADAYDAMTWGRPYREALSADAARQELRRCAGRQFDPRVVEAFLRIPAEEMEDIGATGGYPYRPPGRNPFFTDGTIWSGEIDDNGLRAGARGLQVVELSC